MNGNETRVPDRTGNTASGLLLGLLDQLRDAQYVVGSDGQVWPNDSVAQLQEVRGLLDQLAMSLDGSQVGASLAALFLQRPWLSAFTVRLWSEPEFDDEGGTYMSVHSSVTDVAYAPGEGVPADLCDDDSPDDDLVEEHLAAVIAEFEAAAYQCFGGPQSGSTKLDCVIRRCRLVDVLGRTAISGRDAFRALIAGGLAVDEDQG